ncbi:hypothetical protein TNCV_3342671 [Trichonephila clavipes]|nr:hypothetical protein TNCV_3342671 [Trichonephila clavipes]
MNWEMLNVSMCLVVATLGSIQSEDTCLQHAEDRFRALSARRRRTTTVPQLVADHFASGRKSPLLRCEIVFTMQVCMLCVTLNGRQRKYAGQENTTQQQFQIY